MIKQPAIFIAFTCIISGPRQCDALFTKHSNPCWITKTPPDDSCYRKSYIVQSSLKLPPPVPSYRSPSNRRNAHAADSSYPTDLDTAYEWLATDRFAKDPVNHVEIRWLHPSESGLRKTFHLEDDCAIPENLAKMPMYPLSCVHVPYSQGNYTLVNIEKRNVNMAMKTMAQLSVLCELASKGHRQNSFGGDSNAGIGYRRQVVTGRGKDMPVLNRVVVTCRAVGIADIHSIDNPHVSEYDYAGNEYLVSNVKVRPVTGAANAKPIDCQKNDSNTRDGGAENVIDCSSVMHQLISDYQGIKAIYSNSYSIASNELPPFAIKAIKTMPDFIESDVGDEMKFWVFIETWQMLCNTIRQAKRDQLASTVNELSVEVAMQFDGPLQLPVRRSSLPKSVQRQLQELERNASRDFMEMGVDPVLDFQQLIEMTHHWDRVTKLGWMISNELVRLEAKESLIRAFWDDEIRSDMNLGGFS